MHKLDAMDRPEGLGEKVGVNAGSNLREPSGCSV